MTEKERTELDKKLKEELAKILPYLDEKKEAEFAEMKKMLPDLTEERFEWMFLTPEERFRISGELLDFYIKMGGNLDPEYDPQSPFNSLYYPDGPPGSPTKKPNLKITRRAGV